MRSSDIKTKIRRYLGEESDDIISDAMIYNVVNDIQRRVAEDFLCVEKKFNLVTTGVNSYDLTTGGAITRSNESNGKVGGKTQVLVNSTPTIITFDTAFVGEITNLAGSTVPAYKFFVENAYVTDPLVQENITLISKTLSTITLQSTSDSTIVNYSIGMSNAYTETVAAGTATGFYRINFIELPSGKTWKLKEVNRSSLTWLKRNSITAPISYPTHFSVFDDTIEFWYNTDNAETYVVHYYKVPTITASNTVELETPKRFDPLILDGSVCELAPLVGKFDLAEYFSKKYITEMEKAPIKQEMTKSQFNKIKDK